MGYRAKVAGMTQYTFMLINIAKEAAISEVYRTDGASKMSPFEMANTVASATANNILDFIPGATVTHSIGFDGDVDIRVKLPNHQRQVKINFPPTFSTTQK